MVMSKEGGLGSYLLREITCRDDIMLLLWPRSIVYSVDRLQSLVGSILPVYIRIAQTRLPSNYIRYCFELHLKLQNRWAKQIGVAMDEEQHAFVDVRSVIEVCQAFLWFPPRRPAAS